MSRRLIIQANSEKNLLATGPSSSSAYAVNTKLTKRNERKNDTRPVARCLSIFLFRSRAPKGPRFVTFRLFSQYHPVFSTRPLASHPYGRCRKRERKTETIARPSRSEIHRFVPFVVMRVFFFFITYDPVKVRPALVASGRPYGSYC